MERSIIFRASKRERSSDLATLATLGASLIVWAFFQPAMWWLAATLGPFFALSAACSWLSRIEISDRGIRRTWRIFGRVNVTWDELIAWYPGVVDEVLRAEGVHERLRGITLSVPKGSLMYFKVRINGRFFSDPGIDRAIELLEKYAPDKKNIMLR